MQDYLIFRLHGAMASWGIAAVGEERPTASFPTRSALLGLLAAALGIDRNDTQTLTQLSKSVFFGIKQLSAPQIIRDFHTSDTPTNTSKVLLPTRKFELQHKNIATILSSRDYVCDGVWHIAVWINPKVAFYDLVSIKQALLFPKYMPYLGRRSCPIGIPMGPELVSTSTLKEALDTEFPPLTFESSRRRLDKLRKWREHYIWESNKSIMGVDEEHIFTLRSRHQPHEFVAREFVENISYSFQSSESEE